ncbi:MAG TPA: YihY/virulence factor BrkB family protein [Solibacterales bacterium]|nr:YihY/virulence factor BrkB family protein [Bryobacterales bacterium]
MPEPPSRSDAGPRLDWELAPGPAVQQYRRWRPTAMFLARTEVHVFALSIAASVLLSFYPFLFVLAALCRNIFSPARTADLIALVTSDFFGQDLGSFISRNLFSGSNIPRHVTVTSAVLLLFTANGVFEPLEVALNRVWGITENRSYLKNQILSFGLILICGAMVMSSILLTARNQDFVRDTFHLTRLPVWLTFISFKVAAVPILVAVLFLVYWILPNRRIPARPLVRVAVVVGLALESLKYAFLLLSPWLMAKLSREYGVFQHSVALVLVTFVASMIVLAGAEWSARAAR